MRPIFSETDLNERPFLVFWEVTRACALACKHCRAVAQPRPHPDELTHEEAPVSYTHLTLPTICSV